MIDETTAMAVGQPTPAGKRYAFWVDRTDPLSRCWQLGSLVGALVGKAIDPATSAWTPLRRRSSWRCCGPR